MMVVESCVSASLDLVVFLLGKMAVLNLFFNFLTRLLRSYHKLYHVLSLIFGMMLLYGMLPDAIPMFIAICLLMYSVLTACHFIYTRTENVYLKSALFGKLCIVSIIVAFEFLMQDQDLWNQCRGLVMIQAMKFISLLFMFDHESYPRFLEILGYVFYPPNIMFGPFVPFITYQTARLYPMERTKLWVKRMLTCAGAAVINLLISNCMTQPIIQLNFNKWVIAYFKALSYRTSHYFVSYLSEFSLVAAGVKDFYTGLEGGWGYRVAEPFNVELPTSLKSVIICWNIPMHMFLKDFVYRAWIPRGRFTAMILTFFISSLLHGLNNPVTLVLLSLGVASYAESKFRYQLSFFLDTCVGVDDCYQECGHTHTRTSVRARIINTIFSFITMFQLVYLGSIMDLGPIASIDKYVGYWSSLNFLGHYMTLFMYLTVIFH